MSEPSMFEPEPGVRLHYDVAGEGDQTLIVANAADMLPVHGDADIIPLQGSEAYERLIPDARLLRLPGVGHYPHLERPDVFFPAVDAFLD
jgi:hypothetical protein